jgi:hypothetical protein
MSKFQLHNQRNEHLYRILHNRVSGLTMVTQVGGLLAMLDFAGLKSLYESMKKEREGKSE